jgi:Ca2+-transporting ATPase
MASQWHTIPLGALEKELNTSFHDGLSGSEAAARLKLHGPNKLPEARRTPLFLIFLRQFQSPLIYILLGAAVVVFALEETVDALVILFVLVFNAIVGTLQEGRAQNTLAALRRFTETSATVLRDGVAAVIPDIEVARGDILVLREGEKVPADARVIESRTLTVDEAALTGESVPVHKNETAIETPSLSPQEQKNMLFKGTNVVRGSGIAAVVATGTETVIGKLARAVASMDTEIPLKRDIRQLSKLIILVVSGLSAGVFLLGVLAGQGIREMFTVVVSLGVSVVPEGLPVALTLVLASGVWRMAKRNALVKKLQAVEALGQAQVIAVDKTGTLTRNEMVIRKVYAGKTLFEVGGAGYEPKGEVKLRGAVVDPANHPELLLAGKIAALSSGAAIAFSEERKVWQIAGDPTEGAMGVFAAKVGFHKTELEKEAPLAAEMPFDYATRYHATVHREGRGLFLSVAGAPEAVFALSDKVRGENTTHPFTQEWKKEFETAVESLSEEGFRTVAFAYAELASGSEGKEFEAVQRGQLTLAGVYAMEDSLRPEVPEAMARAKDAGVRVVMITGDHKITAQAIAKEAGIWKEGDAVISGSELESMDEKELAARLETASVFARVTPEHKMKIIQAYKRRGEIVAMTGDGVNDAPPLVAADLGVAMGKIGTEVAKEASDIVLLDDNFGSIVAAVEEGRTIYKTIQKVILYLFSTSLGEVLTIVGAILLGWPLPVVAVQILWLNLVTDGFLTVALAMEKGEPEFAKGSFSAPNRYLVNKTMLVRIVVMAVPMMLGSLFVFGGVYAVNLPKALTLSLTTLAIFQWLNAYNCRFEKKSVFRTNPFGNHYVTGAMAIVIVLQLLAVYHPFMQSVLRTVPLSLSDWMLAVGISFSIIVAEEIRKLCYARFEKNELS